ncbi:MAG: DUF2029 domain-containing protein [Candidatus Kerfeldbacteria bacterium]|nr:DUF2029 domain-containing protein [Candidatus Kerfeldbacteria bacterium]
MTSTFLDGFVVRNGHLLVPTIIPLIALLLYLWLDQRPTVSRQRWQFVIAVVASLAVMTMIGHMQIAGRGLPPGPTGVHDGAVQTEEAAKFLLQGTNPYSADYRQTPFGGFGNTLGPQYDNIAWTHYAYPPANIILTVPFLWLQSVTVSWIDSRTLYTLALLVLAALLVWTQTTWPRRTRMVLLTLANPLIWLYAIVGFNDILAAVGVVGAAVLLTKRRWRWAGIAFGIAIGAKQSSWMMAPLWLLLIWWQYQQHRLTKSEAKQIVWSTLMTGAAFLLPFFLWSPTHFYDDLIRYVSGAIPMSYPVSGMTLQQYLYIWHLIPSPLAPTPTLFLEALVGIPVLLIVGRWLRQRPTVATFLVASIVLSLSMLLVNRFFYENYLSGLLAMAVAAYALTQPHDRSIRT